MHYFMEWVKKRKKEMCIYWTCYIIAAGVAMGAIRFMSKRKHIKKKFFFTHNLKMGDV